MKRSAYIARGPKNSTWSITNNSTVLPCKAFPVQGGIIQWASCQIRKITGAHAPGMPGTFSPPPRVSDMHHGTCVTHVPWCMQGSLTSGSFEVGGEGKRSRHSRCMRNPKFYVSGKRPMDTLFSSLDICVGNRQITSGFPWQKTSNLQPWLYMQLGSVNC